MRVPLKDWPIVVGDPNKLTPERLYCFVIATRIDGTHIYDCRLCGQPMTEEQIHAAQHRDAWRQFSAQPIQDLGQAS